MGRWGFGGGYAAPEDLFLLFFGGYAAKKQQKRCGGYAATPHLT